MRYVLFQKEIIDIRILAFLFFLSIHLDLSAQTYTKAQIDSLLNLRTLDEDLEKNLQLYTKMYNASEKINYEKGKAKSLLSIGEYYMLTAQYEQAIEYFDKIENLPVHTDAINYERVRAMQNKSFAYASLGFYEDALKLINKSYKLTSGLRGDDKYHARGRTFDDKAILYIEMKKSEDSVLYYLKSAARQYKKIKDQLQREMNLRSTYINIAISFSEMNQSDSALFYSHKLLSDKKIDLQQRVSILQTIGAVHQKNHRLDSAISYYKKTIEIAHKLRHLTILRDTYKALTSIYEQKKDDENYLVYNKKYLQINDSLTRIEKNTVNKASEIIQNELTQKTEKTKQNLYLIIIGIIIALCIIAYFAFIFFKNYSKEKREKELRQEKIDENENELKKVKLQINESFDEIIALAKENHPNFYSRFQEVYPEFHQKLLTINPELAVTELQLSAYIYLGFSNKEIANYTFKSLKTIESRKTNLRKRLNITSSENLFTLLSQL